MTRKSLAVAVAALLVAALAVAVTVPSLGTLLALCAGGLVLLGAIFGRLRLAIVPLVLGAGLAVVAVAAPAPDAGEAWSRVIPVVLVSAGIGASLCVAVGALVRRLGRLIERSG
jgi:hypothetical protein